MSTKNRKVPEELVKQNQEINDQWLASTKYRLEPYWDESGDFAGQWKYRLFHRRSNDYIMGHILPEEAHGHFLYLTTCAIEKAHDEGVERGKQLTLISSMKAMCAGMGVRYETFVKSVTEGNT